MRQIGVRELKEALSQTLAAVGRGEQVRITHRGRPIADIVPAGSAQSDQHLRRLVAEGSLTPASAGLSPKPPTLSEGKLDASALVVAERTETG